MACKNYAKALELADGEERAIAGIQKVGQARETKFHVLPLLRRRITGIAPFFSVLSG